MTKLAAKYAENSKVVIRNLRRDFLDSQKNLKKNSELSEDDLKKITNDVQKLTDSSIEKIDEILKNKKRRYTESLILNKTNSINHLT